jgi:ATP-binding cassette subfamily B (MDR/TAP) protein 1
MTQHFTAHYSLFYLYLHHYSYHTQIDLRCGCYLCAGDAFQRFILLAAYAVAFYVGALFLENGTITDFNQILRVFLAVTLSAEAVGRVSSQAPDTAKAQRAANAIFALLDSVEHGTPIDPLQVDGEAIGGDVHVEGRVEFKNVRFSYPTRPEALVLDEFNLIVEAGQTVALVGPSGSGKSTVIQLLQRFYDPTSGSIMLDDKPLSELNVPDLRNCMSLVSQEPVLFADSISYK